MPVVLMDVPHEGDPRRAGGKRGQRCDERQAKDGPVSPGGRRDDRRPDRPYTHEEPDQPDRPPWHALGDQPPSAGADERQTQDPDHQERGVAGQEGAQGDHQQQRRTQRDQREGALAP